MKLNLDKQFMDLKGYPLKAKLDNTLANILALMTEGNPRMMIKWAADLINYGEIEINKEEIIYLMNIVKDNSTLTNLAKSQLLEELNKAIKNSNNMEQIK